MTKAAPGMSAVIFPPFFCGAFASYSVHKTPKTNLYLMYNFMSPTSINLDKYQEGLAVFRGENAPS